MREQGQSVPTSREGQGFDSLILHTIFKFWKLAAHENVTG
jgi:hypothetical protein